MHEGDEVLPAVSDAATFHSFSPLTLFDCGGGVGPQAFVSVFLCGRRGRAEE